MNKQEANAPAGDGWAALGRLREMVETLRLRHAAAGDSNGSRGLLTMEKYMRGCADAEASIRNAIDRELAARPAKEPGLTIAETEKHTAAMCDETGGEDAEVENWSCRLNLAIHAHHSFVDDQSDPRWPIAKRDLDALIDAAVRIMRERGAALKRAEWERNVAHGRAVKAEAEVARLTAVVEKIKEATK